MCLYSKTMYDFNMITFLSCVACTISLVIVAQPAINFWVHCQSTKARGHHQTATVYNSSGTLQSCSPQHGCPIVIHLLQWLEVLLLSISVYIDNSTHQPNISHLSHLRKSHSTDCKHGSNIPAQDQPSVDCDVRELLQSSWIDPGHCAEALELLDALSYLGEDRVGRMHPTRFQRSYRDYMPSQLKVDLRDLAYQHHTCMLDLLQTP